jgi:hypothetical protein
LRPDLDLATAQRAFELIVELKAGAGFHSHTIGDLTTEQPETYLRAWDQLALEAPADEAAVRRLGTLTLWPPRSQTSPDGGTRAADVSWREVRDVIQSGIHDDLIELDVTHVASDFCDALDSRLFALEGLPKDPRLIGPARLITETADWLESASGRISRKGKSSTDYYVGVFFSISDEDASATDRGLWLYYGLGGTPASSPETSACYWLTERGDNPVSETLKKRLRAAGFEEVKNGWGELVCRIGIAPAELGSDDDAHGQIVRLGEWVLSSLRRADLA